MHENAKHIWTARNLIGCVLLLIGGMAALWLLYVGAKWVLDLPRDLSSVLVAGFIALATSVIVKGVEVRYQFNRKLDEEVVAKRRETYEAVLGELFDLLNSTKAKDRQLTAWISRALPRLMVWASPDAIQGFGKWGATLSKGGVGSVADLRNFRIVVNPMRRDLRLPELAAEDMDALFLQLKDTAA